MTRGTDPYDGRRFRRGLRDFAIGHAVQAIATLLLMLCTVRALSPRDYGAYMVLWGAVELAVPLTSLGLLQAVQQYLPRLATAGSAGQLQRFMRMVEGTRYTLIAALAGLMVWQWEQAAAWIGLAVATPVHGGLFVAMLAAVLIGRFTAEMLESLMEQRDAQTVRALQPVSRLAGMLGLWWLGRISLVSLLWVDLVVSLAAVLIGNAWLRQRVRSLSPGPGLEVSLRELLTFTAHMSTAQLLNAMGSPGAIRLAVGWVLGLELAGAFAFLQQLIMIANRYLPSVLLANMVRPMLISRLVRGAASEVATGFGLLWKVNLVLVLAGAAAVLVSGDALLRLASAGLAIGAGPAMTLLLLGLLATAQTQVVDMAMQVYGLTAKVALTSLLVPLAVPLVMAGGTLAGLTGAAAGVATAQWLRSSMGMLLLQRQSMRMAIDVRGAAGAVGAVLAATSLSLWAGRWTGPAVAAAALLLLYTGALVVIRPLSATEGALIERGSGRRVRFLSSLVRPA